MTWSIIITAPQSERRLTHALNESGYPAFLPLKRTWRTMRGRQSETARPVAPGYVFAIMPPQAIHGFHCHGAHHFLVIPPEMQRKVDLGILSWQMADRNGEFDDDAPKPVKVRGAKPKPRTRNRRTRRIKRLLAAISDLRQSQPLAA
jgi:hypothetical protein